MQSANPAATTSAVSPNPYPAARVLNRIEMTTAVANSPDQSLRQFLVYSVIMHASLALLIVVSAYIQFRDNRWGGVGGDLGGTKVILVPAPGMPMPQESVVTESKAGNPPKGLHKQE